MASAQGQLYQEHPADWDVQLTGLAQLSAPWMGPIWTTWPPMTSDGIHPEVAPLT